MTSDIDDRFYEQADCEFEHMTITELAQMLEEDHDTTLYQVLRHFYRTANESREFLDYVHCFSELSRQALWEGNFDPADGGTLMVFAQNISEASPAHKAWRDAMMNYARTVTVRDRPRTTIEQEWRERRALELQDQSEAATHREDELYELKRDRKEGL